MSVSEQFLDELDRTTRRGEGRPARLTKWEPKKWKPLYQAMVLLHAAGRSNVEIAERLEVTPQQVSNVLCSQQGKKHIERANEKLEEHTVEQISGTLRQIATKTANLTLALFEDDELVAKSPFALIDRGLRIMEGSGHLKKGSTGESPPGGTFNQYNFGMLPPALIESLTSALEKADEVKKLHNGRDLSALNEQTKSE